MISVRNIDHYFGKFHALKNVSFDVPDGCVAGFIGPNGAGKSTTLRTLAGILIPTQGEVELGGISLFQHPFEARRQIGYMQETPVLYREMRIREYLEFVAQIKQVQHYPRRVQDVMERCGIAHIQRRLVGNISKGNRQRVALAQALLGNPSVLLLDEPTSAMDPAEVIKIRQFIRELKTNMTILLSSHILSEVSQICDYLIFIRDGQIQHKDYIANIEKLIKKSENLMTLRFSEDPAHHISHIRDLPGAQVKDCDSWSIQLIVDNEDKFFPALYACLYQHNIPLREIVLCEHPLEVLFRDNGAGA
jgi:ABC-2 type transport system ATP-binding protein